MPGKRMGTMLLSVIALAGGLSACGSPTPTPTSAPPNTEIPAVVSTAVSTQAATTAITSATTAAPTAVATMAATIMATDKPTATNTATNTATEQPTAINTPTNTATTTSTATMRATESTTMAATSATTPTMEVMMVVTTGMTSAPTMAATMAGTMIATPANGSTGFIRAIHAAPDAPAIDIYLNGNAAYTSMIFGDSTGFAELQAGTYAIDVRPARAAKTSTPIYSTSVTLQAGDSVNIVALGLTTGKGNTSFRLAEFPTDRTPTDGQARVDVIHAVPDGPGLDVRAGGKVIVSGLTFGKITNPAVNLKSGAYYLSVVPTGQTIPIVIDLKAQTLQADTLYTIVAIGQLGDKSIRGLILTSVRVGGPISTMAATSAMGPTPIIAPTSEVTIGPTLGGVLFSKPLALAATAVATLVGTELSLQLSLPK